MSMFRVALLTTAVVFMLPPSQARADEAVPGQSIEVQFLGGTVKTIPADSFGTLNLKDLNELRFQYGTSVYRLPYTEITETDVTDANNKGHWLVHMPGRKQYRTLAVTYHDPNGAENTLNFQVDAKIVEGVDTLLSLRRKRADVAAGDPDSYWGDRIWKTKHTLPLWEQQQQQQKQAAANAAAGGTK